MDTLGHLVALLSGVDGYFTKVLLSRVMHIPQKDQVHVEQSHLSARLARDVELGSNVEMIKDSKEHSD